MANSKRKKELRNDDKLFRDKQAQSASNASIRGCDASYHCASCNSHRDGQYHTGHYKSRGGHQELRLEESDYHKQYNHCSDNLSGNIENYRMVLVENGRRKNG